MILNYPIDSCSKNKQKCQPFILLAMTSKTFNGVPDYFLLLCDNLNNKEYFDQKIENYLLSFL